MNVDARLLDRFGADLRAVCGGTDRTAEPLPDGRERDPWMGLILATAGPFTDVVNDEAPLRDATSVEEIEAYPWWPGPELLHEPAITRGLVEQARAAQAAGYAVVAIPGSATQSLFHVYDFLRGFDTRMMDMHLDPRFYHALVERITQVTEEYLTEFLTPLAAHVDLICMGEDLGTQRGPFMSVSDYRTFCKPYQRRWIESAKRCAPEARLVLHSCGAIRDFIPDFIDIGVEVLNPIQPKARGHGAGRHQARLRPRPLVHRRLRHPGAAALRDRGSRSATAPGGSSRTWPTAAASSSRRPTRSCPRSRRATSSPCTTARWRQRATAEMTIGRVADRCAGLRARGHSPRGQVARCASRGIMASPPATDDVMQFPATHCFVFPLVA